ncbi:hypothetical protein C8J57DRAFT_1479364 [Mycena rebaudengoi]|nr:hypothetical protein C8J57DRAFT_1479364 [Mycena rebaudengoi]
MKRGFLNSSKAKARPLGPPLAAVSLDPKTSAPARFPIGKLDVIPAIPEGYEYKRNYKERDPRAGSHPDAITYTTLPIDAAPGESTTECLFYPGSKEVVMNLPGFPQPVKKPKRLNFRMNPTPGKGSGLFSTRALKMGDLILSERPLFVGARGVPVDHPPDLTREQYYQYVLNDLEKVYKYAVDRMDPEPKAAFMALANSHKEDGSGPLVGIVRTNGVGVRGLCPSVEGHLGTYSAVCKDISRLNHSCSANTSSRWDLLSFSFQLFAVRDIDAGEELTYTYTDAFLSTAKRQADLKSYDFVCTCAACTDASASDERRAVISAFNPSTEQLSTPTDIDGLITKYHAQMARIEREGLEHKDEYFNVTTLLLEMYICKGDCQRASEVAALVDKMVWVDEPMDVKDLLDPSSPAYPAHHMWRSPVGSTAKIFQQMASLAGNGAFEMKQVPITGGAGFIFVPKCPA